MYCVVDIFIYTDATIQLYSYNKGIFILYISTFSAPQNQFLSQYCLSFCFNGKYTLILHLPENESIVFE